MDKIMVTPNEVRGHGNILESRNRNDFIRFHSELNNGVSTVTVDNLPFTYFSMKLEGLQISISVPSWPNAVLTEEYTVNVTVTTVENSSPVPNVVVTLRDYNRLYTYLAEETTDSDGECTLSFTPDTIGDLTLILEILSQNQYAEKSMIQTILVAMNCGIPQLITDVSFDSEEDDYVITYVSNISSRTNLESTGFISNVYIAEGGEVLTDKNGNQFTANKGDVLIEHTTLEEHTEQGLLFEDDITLLNGAIYAIYQDTENDRYAFMKTRYDESYTNFMGD